MSETLIPATGELVPPRMACSHAGGWCGRGSPPPTERIRGCHPWKFFFEIFDAKSRVWGQGTSLYYSRRLKLLQMYFNLIE